MFAFKRQTMIIKIFFSIPEQNLERSMRVLFDFNKDII
jgi:hypothetical protein